MSADPRVLRQVASWCLAYPDRDLVDRLPLLIEAVAEQPTGPGRQELARFLEAASRRDVGEWQREYVEVFDLSRHHALYLSYWTDGDTRRRGETLIGFKQRYRQSGFLIDTHGELPDYLPMLLEFSAIVDPAVGVEMLQEHRRSIELLRLALLDTGTPYADVLVAICSTLPGVSPADRAAVMQMAGSEPPVESVGLESFDPRLLPMAEVR